MRLSLAQVDGTRLHNGVKAALLVGALAAAGPARAAGPEPPALADAVARGALPPLADRLPEPPRLTAPDRPDWTPGRYGGRLRMLIRGGRDARALTVLGYARLVGYDHARRLGPDLLEAVRVDDGGRSFTLTLRAGHRWSDGAPFTSEDFRYWWQDVANHAELSPLGPPRELLVDGQPPAVEFVDATTVRYRWPAPNPEFLPALAGASPLFIYAPAHYLKRLHAAYADPADLAAAVAAAKQRDWAALHARAGNLYARRNPDLPSLQPWVLVNRPPTERYVARRNPYYHAVDPQGRQLPYIDEVVLIRAQGELIPAKAAAGEADLVALGLSFRDAAVLKAAEANQPVRLRLWDSGRGAQLALYPNFTAADPVWRPLLRDPRFRRALSLAVDRAEISQAVYQGLAPVGNNGLLPASPLYREADRMAWAQHDPAAADRLLDAAGLARRDGDGRRLLADGRPLQLVVSTGDTDPAETDVLELVAAHWRAVGVELVIRSAARSLFRSRAESGDSVMSLFYGIANGTADAAMSPAEWAPTGRRQLNWPAWGLNYESGGKAGARPDLPAARRLLELYADWRAAADRDARTAAWAGITRLHADQLFTIGLVGGAPQPVLTHRDLRNLPERGTWAWTPTAYFGAYRPDSFWYDR